MAKRLSAKQRRRRTFTVLILLVLVGLTAWAVLHFSSADEGEAPPTTSPTASAEPSEEATPSDSVDYEGLGPSGLPSDAPACEYADIQVEALTDKESYAADDEVEMRFSIVNTGDVPCQVNVGTGEQDYEIKAEGETVYQYSHCTSDRVDQVVTLNPDEGRVTTPIEWDRTYSDEKNCDDDLDEVPAGGVEYTLTVYVAGIESVEPVPFTLK